MQGIGPLGASWMGSLMVETSLEALFFFPGTEHYGPRQNVLTAMLESFRGADDALPWLMDRRVDVLWRI